jgi:hypothetical protein
VKKGNLFGAGASAACAAILMASTVLVGTPAEAATNSEKVSKAAATQVAKTASVADPETTSSIGEAAVDPGCQRPRKRLWVEGE